MEKAGQKNVFILIQNRKRVTLYVDLIVAKSQVLQKWEILSYFLQSHILSRNRQYFVIKRDPAN